MATFIQIDERAGVLVLVAIVLGVWFYAAPEHATQTVANLKDGLMEVLP